MDFDEEIKNIDIHARVGELEKRIEALESKNEGLKTKVSDQEELLSKTKEKLLYEMAQREETEQALKIKDIAFKELLEQFELEKKTIQKDIMTNVDNLLIPSIKKLQRKGTAFEEKQLAILEKNINEMTSSFANRIGQIAHKMTPRELEICNMIRNGLTIKEISTLLYTSPRTVETHRNNIRKKLDLSKKKINLAIYLRTL